MDARRSAARAAPSYEATIRRFYLFRAVRYLNLWMPVWVVFLQHDRGLSLAQIGVMGSVFSIVLAVSEIPTGGVADTWGPRTSLLIGIALHALGLVGYALAPTFALLLAVEAFWAVASSFHSGAEEAFLYDTLRAMEREGEYRRVAGRSLAISQGSTAAGGALGGLLATIHLGLPFLVMAVIELLAAGIVLTWRDPPREATARAGRRRYHETLGHAWRALATSVRLRLAVIYAAVVPAATFMVLVVLLQPQAVVLGLPIAAMGVLYLAIQGAGLVGAAVSHRVVERIGEDTAVIAIPLLLAGGLVALAAVRSLPGLVVFAGIAFVSAASWPVAASLVLRESPAGTRATTVSAQMLLNMLILSGLQPGLGYLADRHGLPAAYVVLAAGLIAVLLPVLVVWVRQPAAASPAGEG